MDYLGIPWASWKGACGTEVLNRRTCMTWYLWEVRPESQQRIHDPRVLQQQGVNMPINLDETVGMVLQFRAQSSQVRFFTA